MHAPRRGGFSTRSTGRSIDFGVLAIDWGNWAVVYRFMRDHKSKALEADITLSNIRLLVPTHQLAGAPLPGAA